MRRALRFEVDLAMLPAGAGAGDVGPFCALLEKVMREDGDPVEVVETFQAKNDPNDMVLVAWGWPTEKHWDQVLDQYFNVRKLRRK